MQIRSAGNEAKRSKTNLMEVEIGQTKQRLLDIMGLPTRREAYRVPPTKEAEFPFYRTLGWDQLESSDTDGQITPVAVQNGRVVVWGEKLL